MDTIHLKDSEIKKLQVTQAFLQNFGKIKFVKLHCHFFTKFWTKKFGSQTLHDRNRQKIDSKHIFENQ